MSPRLLKTVAALAICLFPAVHGDRLFTVNCQPLTTQRGDPIVSPGQISSHVHAVTGGTNFALTETNEQAVAAKNTTCDKVLDNSNYWQPQLYHERSDGKFEIVKFEGNVAYYIERACDYAPGRTNCGTAPKPIAPPQGLRMVTGNPFLRTYNSSDITQRAIQTFCLDGPNEGERPTLPRLPCGRIRAETFFPSCWDGKNLDSDNHKSHMAFPAIGDYNGGVCPESHPTAILSVFFEFFYDTGSVQNPNRLVFAHGDASGYGLHGDYLQGWTDQDRLETALDTCEGGPDSAGCSLAVLAGGKAGQPSAQVPATPAPEEDVGLNGPLSKLPGDNPVTGEIP
ncbi:hypothetical protein V2G26_005872 [Clonostachys chloroleuca]